MYELFISNAQDEALYLLREEIPSLKEAMKALKECEESHCQIERFDVPESLKATANELLKQNIWKYAGFIAIYGRYTLIATKHNNKITKYY